MRSGARAAKTWFMRDGVAPDGKPVEHHRQPGGRITGLKIGVCPRCTRRGLVTTDTHGHAVACTGTVRSGGNRVGPWPTAGRPRAERCDEIAAKRGTGVPLRSRP